MVLVRPPHDPVLDLHRLEPLAPLLRPVRLVRVHRLLVPAHQLVRHLRVVHIRRRSSAYQPRARVHPDVRLVAEVRLPPLAREPRVGVGLASSRPFSQRRPFHLRLHDRRVHERPLLHQQPPTLHLPGQLLEQPGRQPLFRHFLPEAADRRVVGDGVLQARPTNRLKDTRSQSASSIAGSEASYHCWSIRTLTITSRIAGAAEGRGVDAAHQARELGPIDQPVDPFEPLVSSDPLRQEHVGE